MLFCLSSVQRTSLTSLTQHERGRKALKTKIPGLRRALQTWIPRSLGQSVADLGNQIGSLVARIRMAAPG
jgi:hypothetical protein